jgi:hypothetical protein
VHQPWDGKDIPGPRQHPLTMRTPCTAPLVGPALEPHGQVEGSTSASLADACLHHCEPDDWRAPRGSHRRLSGRLPGSHWHDTGVVFTTATGTPLGARHVRKMFQDVCERAGIGRDWAPRDLRHTFVSLLSDDGMAIEKIARLAGHASSHVTETVYRQELRPVLQEGAEVMDRLFGGVNKVLAE